MPRPFPRAPVFDPFLVKVVAGIVAAVSGLFGVGVTYAWVHPGCRGGRDHTADMVRWAVRSWQLAENNYRACPSLHLLVQDRHLDPTDATRAEHTMAIFCREDDVMVRWAGPDEVFGTVDDATAPN